MIVAELIDADSQAWQDCLAAGPHDVYHLPAYTQVFARLTDGLPMAIFAHEGPDSLLLPIVVRPIGQPVTDRSGLVDAASAYGYPGPLLRTRDPHDPAFLARAIDAMIAVLKARRVVSLFVRMHPGLPLPHAPLAAAGQLLLHGDTVAIDLTRPEDQLWSETRQGHRNEINRARRAGAIVRLDNQLHHLAEFEAIYEQTMHRLGASDQYHFPPDFYRDMHAALHPALHLATVDWDGEIVAAGLFTETSGIVQYFLSGTRESHLPQAPTKIMIDEVRRWAMARGNHTLYLGGGLGGREDSLFRFKAGFSHGRAPFHSWRVITDPDAYDALSGIDLDPDSTASADSFFPRYRRPRIEPPSPASP